MLKSFLSLMIHHRAFFDVLIQRGLIIILKVTIGNLCQLFHDIIIIRFSTSLNLKT